MQSPARSGTVQRGSQAISGQIANYQQGVSTLYQGTSMAHADLLDPADGTVKTHVITGTMGGHVYAIALGDRPALSRRGPLSLNVLRQVIALRL